MPLLPLTPGLVISAMLRFNNGLFAPHDPDCVIMRAIGSVEDRISAALPYVLTRYDAQKVQTVSDLQIAEEFEGTGFYRPEKEQEYIDMLGGRADLFEWVSTAIAKRSA